MKIFSKILICLMITFFISVCIISPSYAGIINQDDWNQFVNGMYSSSILPSSWQNATVTRVILTIIRIAEVLVSGGCIILLTVMAIRYFTISSGYGKYENRGAIRNSLILCVLVFSFEGIIEIVIQMFI